MSEFEPMTRLERIMQAFEEKVDTVEEKLQAPWGLLFLVFFLAASAFFCLGWAFKSTF